ncbi:hypothetical protein [Bradyrhizobium betae]|uniref:Uncharacterized protein n=1 Tax=Bradyrhizobium betae TaxID=244734 RepID=A0A5P6PFA7_9BRAD|nr:hypothetical protein [Bradyrhizobium betae]MCS3725908.1 hypothetical protein [Bradyrhizobium betae]QFI76966.1 hypothetical protein F8237_34020 [Bradyrhizobium betae]
MGLDAQYRSLVGFLRQEPPPARRVHSSTNAIEEDDMGRGLLLWMLGVPIPVILLLWLFFGR